MIYSSFGQNKARLWTKAKTGPDFKLGSAVEVSGTQSKFFSFQCIIPFFILYNFLFWNNFRLTEKLEK